MTAHLVLVVSLLWHLLTPASVAPHRAGAPSLRAQRSTMHAVATIVRATPRESTPGAQALDASPPPIVLPPSFIELPAPSSVHARAPEPPSFSPIARGPPSRASRSA